MIKEKYKQLCLSHQFGGIRTTAIHIEQALNQNNI